MNQISSFSLLTLKTNHALENVKISFMKLLLHTCCADCLLRFLEVLGCRPQDNLLRQPKTQANSPLLSPKIKLTDITIYFFNPNIYPKSEYDHRLETLRWLTERYGLELIIADYQPQDFFCLNPATLATSDSSSQFKFPPKSLRCQNCWSLRLGQTLDFAVNFNQAILENSPQPTRPSPQIPPTSLSSTPTPFTHISTTLLVSQYQNHHDLQAIGSHLTQKSKLSFFAPDTSLAISYKTGGFYKQNYCGCLYSLTEKTATKYFP